MTHKSALTTIRLDGTDTHDSEIAGTAEGGPTMRKGFFDSCDISDTGSVCFWLFLPVAVIVYIIDAVF